MLLRPLASALDFAAWSIKAESFALTEKLMLYMNYLYGHRRLSLASGSRQGFVKLLADVQGGR